MKKIIFLLFAVLILSACSEHKVMDGYIVGKRYIPKHTTIHYNAVTHMNNVHVHHAQYVVWLADSIQVERHNVDDTTFHKLVVGQRYKVKEWQR